MNSSEKIDLALMMKKINEMGITIMIVEHDVDFVSRICNRVIALNYGQKIAEGPPDKIQADPLILEAYIGKEEDYEEVETNNELIT